MPQITFISSDGRSSKVDATPGQSLMSSAVGNGIAEVLADCGGSMTCGTCYVYLEEAWRARLPPASADEQELLDAVVTDRRSDSRLSCQIKITDGLDGLVVRTPEMPF